MNEIKAGDLAIVIRSPKHHACDALGAIVTVLRVRQRKASAPVGARVWSKCSMCAWRGYLAVDAGSWLIADTDRGAAHVTRLKRIPHLEELDKVKQDEEITA